MPESLSRKHEVWKLEVMLVSQATTCLHRQDHPVSQAGRVVTEADKKMEYDRQVCEAMISEAS